MSDKDRGVRDVKSAARTVELLELLANDEGGRSLSDLHEAMGIPRSSLYAILRTLGKVGWVDADPSGTRYSLGIRALLVGTAYIDRDPVVAMARQSMDELSDRLGETIHLGRLDGGDIVYLATRESSHDLRLFSRVGRRLPAHATGLGKALLSQRNWGDVDALLPKQLANLTPHTITDRAQLREELVRTTDRGYAVDDEENTPGIRCFAIVLPMQRPVLDALSCSVPVARLDDAREREIVTSLVEAQSSIMQRARFNLQYGS